MQLVNVMSKSSSEITM